MFIFYFRITVSEAHCRMINPQCSCIEEVLFTSIHFDVTWTRGTFQIDKSVKIKNSELWKNERSMVYLLYSAHVTSCHCRIFTESCYFNIYGNEWVRNVIITVISDNLSHAQCRWLVNFSLTESRRRPNGHMNVATAHHVSRSATLVRVI